MILQTFLLVLIFSVAVETVTWYGVMLEPQGHCSAEWYEPFGDSDTVNRRSTIQFKTRNGTIAKNERKSLAEKEANVLTNIAKRSGLDVESTISLSNVANIDMAPELAIALIIHARIYNKPTKENTFSVQNLLTALSELHQAWSLEANQAIHRMEQFVNQRTLTNCRGSLEDVLEPLQNAFASCIRHTAESEEEVLSCLEEVESLIRLYQNHFLPYLNEALKHIKATKEMVKSMECAMITFRNYANLRLKIHFVLLASYRRSDGESTRKRFFHFLKETTTEIDMFLKYAKYMKASIMKIYEHKESRLHAPNDCKKVRASSGKAIECSYHFCGMLHEDSVCRITVVVSPNNFTKEDKPVSFLSEKKNPYEAAKEFSLLKANELFKTHNEDVQNAVRFRWERKMTSILKTWELLKPKIQKVVAASPKSHQQYSYKLKPKQMRNVNDLKASIEDLMRKRANRQKSHPFAKNDHFKDEL